LQLTPALTLRAGYDYGKHPVPDRIINARFLAIVDRHLNARFGYRFNDTQWVDFSVVKVFENSASKPGNGSTIPAVESRHSQLNVQFICSHLP
jgi:long-chain fatty acid transport protein